jgi:hypothetical protein
VLRDGDRGDAAGARVGARLMAEMTGVRVSPGWIAPVRAKAAALVQSSGFTDLV